jgi:hypothetical protein
MAYFKVQIYGDLPECIRIRDHVRRSLNGKYFESLCKLEYVEISTLNNPISPYVNIICFESPGWQDVLGSANWQVVFQLKEMLREGLVKKIQILQHIETCEQT